MTYKQEEFSKCQIAELTLPSNLRELSKMLLSKDRTSILAFLLKQQNGYYLISINHLRSYLELELESPDFNFLNDLKSFKLSNV